MAITTQMRADVAGLYAALFGRAPESDGLGYWVTKLNDGETLAQVAQDMYNVEPARAYYPLSLTNAEIIQQFYVNVLGRTPDADGADYWVSKLNAYELADAASAKGKVINDMVWAVLNNTSTDPAAAASKALFSNKVDVGVYYAVTLQGNSAADATTVLSLVTAADKAAALAAADNCVHSAAFTLTNDIDTATAHIFKSTPVYTPGGNDFINSLQDEDNLTGTDASNDRLDATLGSVNDNAEGLITPKLHSIETVNLEVTGDNVHGIDFQDATGLQALNVTRITANNASIVLTDLEASTTELSVSNATRDGSVSFLYREDDLTATDNAVTLGLSNTRLSALTIDETGDAADVQGEDKGYGFEVVNVNVTGSSNIDTLTIGSNQREDASAADATQTVNIVADAKLEVNNLVATGAEFINLTANADVMIAADERNILTAANDGISTTELRTLTITGAGNVTIDGLNGHIDESAGGKLNGDNGTTLTVNASAMTGDLKLGVQAAADGNLSTVWATHTDKDVSITSGSGNDTIETYTALAGDITTNDGNDTVSVNNGALIPTYLNVEGVSTIDTGAGNDTVIANNLGVTATDVLAGNQSFGQVTAAKVITGAGDDSVTVAALQSAIDWNNGPLLNDANADDTNLWVGASIDTGAGADSVTLTSVAEGASVATGTEDDSLNIEVAGAVGTVLAADTDADVTVIGAGAGKTQEVQADGTVDRLGAIVDMGAGDDVINYLDTDSKAENSVTQLVGRDAELRAGAGADVLNVTALDVVTVVATTAAADTNANVTGVETANFTISNQVDAASALATGATQNDNNEVGASITADVLRFDSSLTAINLDSQEAPLLQDPSNEIYEAGSATAFTLQNLRNEVAVTLKAQEATGVDGDGKLKDDTVADVTLTVDNALANAQGNADAFTLNIAAGSGAFDLNLVTKATTTTPTGGTTVDYDKRVENLTVTLAADDKGHKIDLTDDLGHGFGDAQQIDASVNALTGLANDPLNKVEEGSRQVATSFTVTGGVAGTTLVIENVTADTITMAGAADAKIRLGESGFDSGATHGNNYTITTGTGADVINAILDDVRANNSTDDTATVLGDAVNEADKIDAGAGNDRLIINGGDSLGSTVAATDDDVFEGLKSIENLEIKAAGTNEVVLDEAAQVTNLQNIYITGGTTLAPVAQATKLTIGENFKNNLVVDATKDLSGDYGFGAHVGNEMLFIDNQDTDQDVNLVNLDIKVNMQNGASVDFINTGDKAATINITATLATTIANTIDNDANFIDTVVDGKLSAAEQAAATGVAAGHLEMGLWKGAIDKVVLLDSADVGPDADNGAIAFTMSNTWSDSAFTLDASAVQNNDAASQDVALAWHGELEGRTGNAQVAGIQAGDTGGLTFDGTAETDAKLTVLGTQNDDDITGGNKDDTLSGNAGDDIIRGGLGNDTISGGAGNDDLQGGVGADTIDAGAGDDLVYGGVGADVLTGGTGVDTFKYVAVAESNGDGADTITDFATGTDKISIEGVVAGDGTQNFINLASFATVATAGDGDNSLIGNTGAGNAVMGDAYYATDSGQLVIDVDGNGDITTTADIVIKSSQPIAASDVNFIIDAGAGDDFIRGGQGADQLSGGDGNDTFVLVGSLSSADASAYSAAYVAGGSTPGAVLGATLAAVESKVLRATELLSARGTSEVNAGDQIAGGNGNDVIHVFGTANLGLVNAGAALGVETLVIHSTVTMTLAQLQSLTYVVLDGNEPHTIVVTNNDGSAMTQAAQEAAVLAATVLVSNNNTLTTVTIGSGTAMTVAAFDGAGYVNVAPVVTVAGAALLPIGVPYSLNDTVGNLAADAATNAGAGTYTTGHNATVNTTATVAQLAAIDAAAATVTYTTVTDTATALAAGVGTYVVAGHDVTVNTTATVAQLAAIDGAADTVTYTSVTDTAGNLATDAATNAGAGTYATAGHDATVNTTATVAQLAAIDGAADTVTYTSVTDTAGNLATALNAVSAYTANATAMVSDGTTTLTGAGMAALLASTGDLNNVDVVVDGLNETVNLGTLSVFGGNGMLTLGDVAGSDAYTVNLGTSGVTTVNLEGTGNHNVTAAAAVTETFVFGAAYDGGAFLQSLSTMDKVDVNALVTLGGDVLAVQQANGAAVTAIGDWSFSGSVLTFAADINGNNAIDAGEILSIALVGVSNVMLSGVNEFAVV
ncbi:MAG TPA: DUF4214 domain-containing protein [Paucimonas sp.]|nr:DUF4214 domain-containing protein [Paucimonas sp.]HJW55648.1 DUF4214 domain-containing protein [Burkholderiaceae bacterium]